ncbi:hypothetical protein M0804_011415 [Polistes exclamans]|nr:hypothetical protein M0804_011415 [Polistes exclamans]
MRIINFDEGRVDKCDGGSGGSGSYGSGSAGGGGGGCRVKEELRVPTAPLTRYLPSTVEFPSTSSYFPRRCRRKSNSKGKQVASVTLTASASASVTASAPNRSQQPRTFLLVVDVVVVGSQLRPTLNLANRHSPFISPPRSFFCTPPSCHNLSYTTRESVKVNADNDNDEDED